MARQFTKYPSTYIQASKVSEAEVANLQVKLWEAFLRWEREYLEKNCDVTYVGTQTTSKERDAFVDKNSKAYRKIYDAIEKIARIGVKFWVSGVAAIEKQNKKNK